MSLTDDEVTKILKIIDESGYEDVRLEIGDLKLHMQKHTDGGSEWREATSGSPEKTGTAEPKPSRGSGELPAAVPSAPSKAVKVRPLPGGLVPVLAPMLGMFYRAPALGEKPFVEVGTKVAASDTVCLVEVMKLFNSVNAGVSGIVREILVENGSMVEHDQTLVLIEPDSAGAQGKKK